ncbi:MAG: class I SAM-dependent RNA methyltransferase [Alphaproteobacteria bacterium PRO2]|nr:class I SAM-dependent RNA methyltransferase [Alphaproteobacteria bacterium PRO2]
MKNKIVPLTINEIGAKGDGVALHDGAPVYVPKTAPGDVVEAVIKGERGAVQKIVTRSPHRVHPVCPYFDKCGGCSLQHVSLEFYREWKIAKVKTALSRAGIEAATWGEPVFLEASTRRRTTMTALRIKNDVILGYNEARSHNVLDIERCIVLDPALEEKIQALRPYLPRLLGDQKTCDITLQYAGGAFDMVLTGRLQKRGRFSFEQDEALGEIADKLDIARISYREKDFRPPEIILARKPIVKKFGVLNVDLPPATFLQTSEAGEQALTEIVMNYAEGGTKFLDLFSGCGTFSGHLLALGPVTAIDGDAPAINAVAQTKHPGLTAARRDLFKNPLKESELDAFDTIIFDPPRAGAAAQASFLASSETPRIIGVSCNPASFARDARMLLDGGYSLASLTLVDQFVWSAHVEIAGLFTRP